MQLWYVCKENQLLGPFTESQLHESISKQEIISTDWLRKAEDVDWTLAKQTFIFQEHFSTSSDKEKLPFEENWGDKWVLLQQDTATGTYSQSGPYSTKDLLSRIYQGKAEYTDFVWQQGMLEWKRIGSMSEFIPKDEELVAAAPAEANVEVSRDTIKETVLTNQPVANSYYEQIPLFEEEAKFPLQKSQQKTVRSVEKFPEYYKPIVNKRRRWWFFSFFCFVLSLVIAIWGKNSLSLYL